MSLFTIHQVRWGLFVEKKDNYWQIHSGFNHEQQKASFATKKGTKLALTSKICAAVSSSTMRFSAIFRSWVAKSTALLKILQTTFYQWLFFEFPGSRRRRTVYELRSTIGKALLFTVSVVATISVTKNATSLKKTRRSSTH